MKFDPVLPLYVPGVRTTYSSTGSVDLGNMFSEAGLAKGGGAGRKGRGENKGRETEWKEGRKEELNENNGEREGGRSAK